MIKHGKSNAVPDFTGTVTVFNSLGVTATTLASALVRPSDWNSAHDQFLTISGNTAGASTLSGSNIVLQGGANVTLSANGSTLVFSAPDPTTQSVQTQGSVQVQGSTGAIVFSNSNGISFGGNGSTITASYTVPAQTAFVLSNSNNVSFGTNGSTVTASASFAQSVQTQNSVQVQGSSGQISFSNSNNVTFGFNASTITASASFAQSAQTQNVVLPSAGTQTASSGTVVFSNSNGVTFGMSGSSRITASVETSYAASNHSHGNPTLALTNLTGTTASNSAGLTISLSAGAPGAGVAFSAAGNSVSNGTVVFSNSNGISFGMNGSTITATVNPGAAAGIAAIQGGTQTATSGTVVFSNSNGISFGLSGSTQMTASYTVPGATVFSNSNNVTFGLNGSTVTATATFAQTAQTQSNVQGISAGTQVGRTGDIVFSNSNGISFGMSGSNTVTASYTVPSTAGLLSAVNLSAGTTSNNLSAMVFSNSNGMSFGLNGSTVTGSYTVPNVPAQTAQTIGIYGSSQTYGQSSSSTVDARSLTVVGSGGVSVGMSAGSLLISGQTTAAQTAFVLSNSNNVSFGTNGSTVTASASFAQSVQTQSTVAVNGSTGAISFSNSNNVTFGFNASTVTASASFPAQTAQTVGVYAVSNTTGASSSSTVDARSISFQGAGIVSVGMTNGSVVISASAGASPVNFSAGTTSGNLGSVVFSNSNGVSFGLNGSTITASVNAGAGGGVAIAASNSTFTSGTVVMSNAGGALTISNGAQSVLFSVPATSSLVGASGISISTAGSTISVYQPDLSYFANAMYLFNSQTQTAQQSTSVVLPVQLQGGVSAGFIRMPHTVSIASTSFASTAASAYSYNQQETHNIVLYSLGSGASSQSLQSFSSSSVSFRFSINVSQNTTNNISVTHGLTYPVSNGTSSLSFSYAATNSTMQVSTTHMTALSGMKMWDTQFAGRVAQGRVFMAYGQSTTQTTQGTANLSAARMVHSHIGISQPNNTLGMFGIANSASNQWQQGLGSYSNAGGATTGSIDLSQISSSASHVAPYIQMINQA